MRYLCLLLLFSLHTNCLTNIRVVLTQRETSNRLTPQADLVFGPDFTASDVIEVYEQDTFQEVFGWGGAFTEAAAVTFYQLRPDLQQRVLEAYWGNSGIHYNIGRVPINSCDFSVESYNFDNVSNDFELKYFDTEVTHDSKQLIPFILTAQKTSTMYPINLFASPWSPPGWMKTNGKMGASFDPCLKNDSKQAWALYFSKFLTAYKAKGINFWGVTIQNEPEACHSESPNFEACCYTPEEELEFLKLYLSPQLRKDHPEVNVMIWDHNKDDIYKWVKVLYSDPSLNDYIWGTALHWYSGQQFANVYHSHLLMPQKPLFATEATRDLNTNGDDWESGEAYGADIIGDMNNWVVGWTDWNLLLNTSGGPRHIDGGCDAPIMADVAKQEIYFRPQYYYFGQFTKFVPPKSIKIGVEKIVQTALQGSPSFLHGADIIAEVCSGGSSQLWDFAVNDTNKLLSSKTLADLCFTAPDASMTGANLQLSFSWDGLTCNSNDESQQFSWLHDGHIVNKRTNLCLDIEAVDLKKNQGYEYVTLAKCSNSLTQIWVSDQGKIKNNARARCLDAGGSFIHTTAFKTPSNEVVVVVENISDNDWEFKLKYNNNATKVKAPAHSIQTLIWPSF
eukprot:TRINITY_DN9640_c0_g1_i2.p1 TRINITY_DN9640_c0_g1~~TRINITY_DN9640_c0_g1_i2.p1  ORF type:complete len:619 (-),score=106.86 TRINITY_DN9640_c0_g1_i2:4-1860(-)